MLILLFTKYLLSPTCMQIEPSDMWGFGGPPHSLPLAPGGSCCVGVTIIVLSIMSSICLATSHFI